MRLPNPIAPLGGRARTYATLIVVGISIGFVGWALARFTLEDMAAYWDAGLRLRSGEALYPLVADPNAPDVYRYAPWFAFAWVPLTFLPRGVVEVAWAGVLLAGSVWAVLPLATERRLAARLLAILGASLLFWTATRGNVHPLLIAALVHGAHRPGGPVWIALSASLKGVPILFVLPDIAARRWGRVLVTVGLTAALVLPMLLYGWRLGDAVAGTSMSLFAQLGLIPWILSIVAVMAAATLVAFRWPAFAWIAAATGAIAALPRLLFYDLTYVLVGARPGGRDD